MWTAFLLLCLLIASEWFVLPVVAGDVPSLERQALIDAALGVGALIGALIPGGRSAEWARLRTGWWRLAVGCILFFCMPVILVDAVSGQVPATSISALFALTPVVVVLTVARSSGEGSDLQRLLVPALMGLGGVLCVLPFELPASVREWGAFAVVSLAVVLAGAAAVWLHPLLKAAGIWEGIAIAGGCSAVVLLGWCGVRGELVLRMSALRGELSLISAARMIETLLIIWLLREMEPIRFSARYLVISLMTIVEGFVLLRPTVTGRLVIGIVLLAVGAWWMLAARARESQKSLALT